MPQAFNDILERKGGTKGTVRALSGKGGCSRDEEGGWKTRPDETGKGRGGEGKAASARRVDGVFLAFFAPSALLFLRACG